jgi:hypothetical protein
MSKITPITNLSRPRILVKAAQISAQNYNRTKALKSVLKCTKLPLHADAIAQLQEREAMLNDERLNGDVAYKIQHHISVLAALLGEMHLLGT